MTTRLTRSQFVALKSVHRASNQSIIIDLIIFYNKAHRTSQTEKTKEQNRFICINMNSDLYDNELDTESSAADEVEIAVDSRQKHSRSVKNDKTTKKHKKRSKSAKHHEVLSVVADATKQEVDDSVMTEAPEPLKVPSEEGIWAKQSRRVARNPCTYLLASLFIAIGLSVMAMIVGEFSVSANTGGWQSRGTVVADRHTQLMITQNHQEELFYGDDAVWNNLMNNILSGWEDDDDDSERRRLSDASHTQYFEQQGVIAETWVDFLRPKSDRLDFHDSPRELPFSLTQDLRRKLQDVMEDRSCDMSWYNVDSLTQDVHLWPLWKTESSSSSVLSAPVLRDICEAETKTQKYLEANGLCFGCEVGCLPPYSIVMYARLLVDNGWDLTCDELADSWVPFQAETEAQWTECVHEIKTTYVNDVPLSSCPLFFYTTFVEEGFDVRGGKSRYTSSIFATNGSDIYALYDEVDHFDTAESSNLVEGAYDTQYEDFVGLYLDDSLPNDMALAMGSAVVVALALVLHTRSPFITMIGLVQIILSFPLSFLVYKLVLGLNFFPFLNFIGIFVVFALGAGDVFVAVDKWKNFRLDRPLASTEDIAAQALPDAAVAMFLTTLTTAVAFFATAICPVAPIKMFAIFCGLLVVFDYIMNILLVFPALCVYDRSIQSKGPEGVSCFMICSCFGYFRRSSSTTSKPAPKSTVGRKSKAVLAEGEEEEEDLEATTITTRMSISAKTSSRISSESDSEDTTPSLIRRILSAFYDVLHAIRWPLFMASMAALAVSIYYASTLELPRSSDVRLLDDKYQFEKNYLWRQKLLSSALDKASGSEAYMVWGLKAADTGDQNDPGTWSQLVLEDSFDSSSEEAQVFLRDYCESMLKQPFAIPIDTNYTCPLTKFDRWLGTESQSPDPHPVYTENCNGATGIPMAAADWDACAIQWSQTFAANEMSILSRGGNKDKITILLFPFTSRVRYDDQFDILDEEWNRIEDWVQLQNKNAPQGVRNGYFSSFDFWWYDTNGQMLQTAYSAAGIALGCSAAVILFSSQSVVLTLFCTFTIGYVLTSVTATLVAMGWTLGFLEAICFAILIGVSVDFVIHLGHAYSTAAAPGEEADRGFRTRHALIQMGPSILATALTTILSAIIMLFTVITFFQKFALILFLTVVQASIGSFLILLTMTDCIGPSNPTYLVDKMKELWTTRRRGRS